MQRLNIICYSCLWVNLSFECISCGHGHLERGSGTMAPIIKSAHFGPTFCSRIYANTPLGARKSPKLRTHSILRSITLIIASAATAIDHHSEFIQGHLRGINSSISHWIWEAACITLAINGETPHPCLGVGVTTSFCRSNQLCRQRLFSPRQN